jgi:hypothetical protein
MRAFLPPVSLVGNHAWRFGKSGGANESVGMDALQNSRGQFQVRSLSPAPDSCSKASLGGEKFQFFSCAFRNPFEDSSNEIAAKADQFVDKNNRTVSQILQVKSEHLRSK